MSRAHMCHRIDRRLWLTVDELAEGRAVAVVSLRRDAISRDKGKTAAPRPGARLALWYCCRSEIMDLVAGLAKRSKQRASAKGRA